MGPCVLSILQYTELFISPSGISDLCGTVTGMVTPKGSMSTEGKSLQVSVLPYKCSICPPLVTRQTSNLAILANFKTQNGFLFPVHAMFRHDCPLMIKPASTPQRPVHKKKIWRDSLLIYMLLSAVSVLVVAQRISEFPEELMNNPVYIQQNATLHSSYRKSNKMQQCIKVLFHIYMFFF
jgi:hypothetical protein